MKVYFTLFTFIFLSSTSSAQMHLKERGFFGKGLSCSIDFEVIPWNDSTNMTFLVVTVEKTVGQDFVRKTTPKLTDDRDYFYWNLTGFSILDNGSEISPIRYGNSVILDTLNPFITHIMQGLFLVDDLDSKSDSVELILDTQWGYMLQSMTYFGDESAMLHLSGLSELDPEIPSATKSWYRKLLKDEPETTINPRRE